MMLGGIHIDVRGTVQGVGYRPWVYQLAGRLGLAGTVRNESSGVSIDAFGSGEALDRLIAALQDGSPPAARVRSVTWTRIPFEERAGFTIVDSAVSAEHRVSIPADLATCPDCVRELFDESDRRHRYPFINCTNCGPRYTIVTGAPYDRPLTSMTPFKMCARCQREYDSPEDRRFHAQPNACPDCGPRLVAVTPWRNQVATADAVQFAARAIRAGLTVAVKGIGGFHLACDATSSQAVRRLRDRKQRETKPLAVMVRDVAQAESLAELSDVERALLTSIERPIVLARRKPGAAVAPEVCDDVPLIGLFLPYTPLHHLIVNDAGSPLVMTSGNISDEPMVTSNEAALEQLRDIADLFLLHNRDIVTRVDDSIQRVISGAPVVIRRARGFVPRPVDARHEFSEPVLACGADLKNTFCITSGTSAFLGPHIGDLASLETLREYETAIERMQKFVGVAPTLVAHDLHPSYFSTRYAHARSGVRTIAVQHHHAHVVSVMAEHAVEGSAIGVAYDGTGFGTDNTAWGGEILIAKYDEFERFATFRPIDLAGGDQAIREPWRAALALLDDAYNGVPPLHALPMFDELGSSVTEAVRRMIARRLHTTPARGIGRYFDAFGAMFLNIPRSRYEGDVAFRWNMIADDHERGRYPVVIRDAISPWEIDTRPMVAAALDDFRAGRSAATISARFHNTLAAVTIEVVRAALIARGEMPVVLSGGCFQNSRLAEGVSDGLTPVARVLMNREVPPGDGGIALGQAFIADAQLRAGRVVESGQEVLTCA